MFQIDANVTASISGLTITGGNAGNGDGGGLDNSGKLTVSNSVFSSNTAASGGGLLNAGGTLDLTNCTVSGNSAGTAAACTTRARLHADQLHRQRQLAPSFVGGGLYNSPFDATATLTNCTVSGNSAGDGGGGLSNGSPDGHGTSR